MQISAQARRGSVGAHEALFGDVLEARGVKV
jgi:hypothetical protein